MATPTVVGHRGTSVIAPSSIGVVLAQLRRGCPQRMLQRNDFPVQTRQVGAERDGARVRGGRGRGRGWGRRDSHRLYRRPSLRGHCARQGSAAFPAANAATAAAAATAPPADSSGAEHRTGLLLRQRPRRRGVQHARGREGSQRLIVPVCPVARAGARDVLPQVLRCCLGVAGPRGLLPPPPSPLRLLLGLMTVLDLSLLPFSPRLRLLTVLGASLRCIRLRPRVFRLRWSQQHPVQLSHAGSIWWARERVSKRVCTSESQTVCGAGREHAPMSLFLTQASTGSPTGADSSTGAALRCS